MNVSKKPLVLSKLIGVVSRSEYTPFVILTRSRTGSSYLLDCLISHPEVVAVGEAFRSKWSTPWRKIIVRALFGRHRAATKAVGLKIFYYHPNDGVDEGLWDQLASVPGLKIIHLERRDILNVVLSKELAKRSGKYHRYSSDSTQVKPFYVDVDAIVRDLSSIQEAKTRRLNKFSKNDMLHIYYERLVEDPENSLKEVFEFINVSNVRVEPRLKRSPARDWRMQVVNYSDLVGALGSLG